MNFSVKAFQEIPLKLHIVESYFTFLANILENDFKL